MTPRLLPTCRARHQVRERATELALPLSSLAPRASRLVVRRLGLVDYLPTWEAMRTLHRRAHADHSRTNSGCSSIRPSIPTAWPAGTSICPGSTTAFPSSRSTAAGRSPITARARSSLYALLDLRRRGLPVRGAGREAGTGRARLARAVRRRTRERRGGRAGRVRRGRQDRRTGAAREPRLQLPRVEPERRHGPRAVRAIDPCGYPGPGRHPHCAIWASATSCRTARRAADRERSRNN